MASEVYWARELFDYDSGNNIIRIGKHKTPNANENDLGWYIWTLIYDGSGNIIEKTGPIIGKWSNT